jgi:hypothetical protein
MEMNDVSRHINSPAISRLSRHDEVMQVNNPLARFQRTPNLTIDEHTFYG